MQLPRPAFVRDTYLVADSRSEPGGRDQARIFKVVCVAQVHPVVSREGRNMGVGRRKEKVLHFQAETGSHAAGNCYDALQHVHTPQEHNP